MPWPQTAQQLERMQRKLSKRKDEEKQSGLGTMEFCKDVNASQYVTELSEDDVNKLLRVDCDKMWDKVLLAHSRRQQEQVEGIEYVHHIVAHTLNHPEARWLGRWYLGETFPFAHESHFLTIVSTLLWRTLVQTTKDRIIKKWEENEDLKKLPWCGGVFTPEDKKQAMHQFLLHNRQERSNVENDLVRPLLTEHREEEAGRPYEEVVESCGNLDALHRACLCVFQEQVRSAIYTIQSTMEDRVPFIRELEQNQTCQVEHILNVVTTDIVSERNRPFDRSMEFVFCFLKDRITFDDELQWVLMHQVAQELEQHFKDNPSHNQNESQVHDVAVLGAEVGYVHAIKERMLDLAPHYQVYGSRDTQDMLVTIMKNGELGVSYGDKLAITGGEDMNGEPVQAHKCANGHAEAAGRGLRTFSMHGQGFDGVVNHHENLETRRRQHFYEKMDSFIKRGTQWAVQMKVGFILCFTFFVICMWWEF